MAEKAHVDGTVEVEWGVHAWHSSRRSPGPHLMALRCWCSSFSVRSRRVFMPAVRDPAFICFANRFIALYRGALSGVAARGSVPPSPSRPTCLAAAELARLLLRTAASRRPEVDGPSWPLSAVLVGAAGGVLLAAADVALPAPAVDGLAVSRAEASACSAVESLF